MKHVTRFAAPMAFVVFAADARPARADEAAADPFVGAVGRRVRVSHTARAETASRGRTPDPWVGILESYDGETLSVAVKGLPTPLEIRRLEVRKLEMSSRKQSMWRQGAGIGATVGALIGILPALACANNRRACADDRATAALFAPLIFGAAGGAVGALVGAPLHGDRWEDVKSTRRSTWNLALVRGGIAMSVSFPARRQRRSAAERSCVKGGDTSELF